MCSNNGEIDSGDACGPLDQQQVSRREFRSLVFHLLYAIDATDYQDSLPAVVDTFNRGFDLTIAPAGDIIHAAQEIVDQRAALDEAFKPFLLNWRFERLGVCTKLILRLAFWELQQKKTPPTIVINEAVELAKCFAEKDAYKFINGILDEAVKASEEIKL